MNYINQKLTKLVTTIGPSTHEKDKIAKVFSLGSTCIRLNFSHGGFEEHGSRIIATKELIKELKEPFSIMLDTKGPEIRTHCFQNDKVLISKDSTVSISCDKEILGDNTHFSVDYPHFAEDLKVNKLILLDDGKLHLKVLSIENNVVKTLALNTHTIKNKRRINLPGTHLSIPFLSEKDKQDLQFACEKKLNYVAASFVRNKHDVQTIRNFLKEHGGEHIKIIAKIECQSAIDNFDEILKESDAIMHARGDLGIEIPFEEVPILEDAYAKKCQEQNKPLIIATQMLESMLTVPFPTRAEVTDIYHAVKEGVSCTMLSGESANGDYPFLAVETMKKIALRTEQIFDYDNAELLIEKINKLNVSPELKKLAQEIIDKKIKNIVVTKYHANYFNLALLNLPISIYYFTENEHEYLGYGIWKGVYTILSSEDIHENNYQQILKQYTSIANFNNTIFIAK